MPHSQAILPDGHMGGRRGKLGEDAMMAMTMWIKRKWKEAKVVTALFLDVKSAYPSVYPARLVHSLRQKGCPAYLWKIVEQFLRDRSTRLRLADFLSQEFKIDKGLPQGSPLSVILYILYNSDLLIKSFSFKDDQASLGFIDDVIHLTAGRTLEAARNRLTVLGKHSLNWGVKFGAIFDSAKAQYMVFTHTKPAKSSFLFDDQELQPQKKVKWLGIWFDDTPTFDIQREQVKQKAEITMKQLKTIGQASWGIKEQERGRLILTVLTPRVLYGVQIWFTELNKATVTDMLKVINNEAARFTTGTLKSTPIKYLAEHQGFPDLVMVAKNRVAGYLLSKRSKAGYVPSPVELQIRLELSGVSTRFQNPVQANVAKEALSLVPPGNLEQIRCFSDNFPPWTPPNRFKLEIGSGSKSEEAARITREIQENPGSSFYIYTDGSAHPENGLGAAATTADGKMSLNAYLGRSETASNFECELMGLSLGMEVGAALVRSSNIQSITLLSDSQAAIKRLQNPMAPKPGQYLVHQIFEQLRALPTDISILVKWCPGHAGVPGNELADRKAGQAAEEKTTTRRLTYSASTAKSTVRIGSPGKKTDTPMEFPLLSAIHQLRSNHVRLNQFLFKCKMFSYPICDKCNLLESVNHYLLTCKRYREQRQTLCNQLKALKLKGNDLTARYLLRNPKAAIPLANFIRNSRRFASYPSYTTKFGPK
ncbi:hypothetical protein MJO29_013289 [Puccinia striiformis f. sp. tritici]|nr:hypothetical protein MJO29_013289 [Puccinia striiformis f. sp. tritici]